MEFFFIQDSNDKNEYCIEFSNIEINIPYGVLDMNLYNSLLQAWESKKEVLLPYRRFHLKSEGVNRFKANYTTNLARIGSELPCRLIVFLVNVARENSKNLTPYYFKRNFSNVYINNVELLLDNDRIGNDIIQIFSEQHLLLASLVSFQMV